MLARTELTHLADARHEVELGAVVIRYETSEPSPDRWVAIGSVRLHTLPASEGVSALVVGAGPCEDDAVTDLMQRVATLTSASSAVSPSVTRADGSLAVTSPDV